MKRKKNSKVKRKIGQFICTSLPMAFLFIATDTFGVKKRQQGGQSTFVRKYFCSKIKGSRDGERLNSSNGKAGDFHPAALGSNPCLLRGFEMALVSFYLSWPSEV